MDIEIQIKWESLGGAASVLGNPVTGVMPTPDGIGYYVHYQYGSIYWTLQTGAHEVHGDIRDKWESLGWEISVLGYPISDETKTPDGIGRYNHFQHGSIYWAPQTGAHEVHGKIRDKWESLGWERSFLGYPVSDETLKPDGIGRYNNFQYGSIYWTLPTGAHEVHGDILEHYLSLGGPESYLGYPRTDETLEESCLFNEFTGGWIYCNGSYGVADTPYKVHGGRTYTGLYKPDWNDLRKWTAASPTIYLYRRNVVESAFYENGLRLCIPEAGARYCSDGFPEAEGGWCSELAHFILLKGGVHNINGFWINLKRAYTTDIFEALFSINNLWVPYDKITAWTIEPGDYLGLQNPDHSAIVVGVKWDRTRVWTVEREHCPNCKPPIDCVGYVEHEYVKPDGIINQRFNGVGKLHCSIVDQVACTVQPILLKGSTATGDSMEPGEVLRPNQAITSGNGKYTFVYQSDGNLVLYRNTDGEDRWASNTENMPAGAVIMHVDGNLVMYDTVLNPIWMAYRWHPGNRLVVQNDGNVVIYRPDGNPVWATGTNE